MSKEIIPAKFLEIYDDEDGDKVEILCNIGNIEKPYLQTRVFPSAPLREMIKGYPQYPRDKYLNIEITTEAGRMGIVFVEVEGTEEFKKNFIKPDYFEGLEDSAFFKEG